MCGTVTGDGQGAQPVVAEGCHNPWRVEVEEEERDEEEEDEDDDALGSLCRTVTHDYDMKGCGPSAIHGVSGLSGLSREGTSSSSSGSRAPIGPPVASPKRVPVKNTFVHFDGTNAHDLLGRTESEAAPPRTESDPTGSNVVLPRWPSHHQRALHLEEVKDLDDSDADVAEVDEELAGLSTPTVSQLTGGMLPPAPLPTMPEPAGYGMTEPIMGALQPPAFGMLTFAANAPMWTPTDAIEDGLAQTQPTFLQGPPLGALHRFHQETAGFGVVSPDFRTFTKGPAYEGRLSVVSEAEVHTGGVQRYLVQFTAGQLSRADGVGFVFAPQLPCPKNIQRICSIFVNQRGMICMRIFGDVIKAPAHVKPLKIGDWVEMSVDLENRVASFNIWTPDPNTWWPTPGVRPKSSAEFRFGKKFNRAGQSGSKPLRLNTGYFACVVQNIDVTVTLGS